MASRSPEERAEARRVRPTQGVPSAPRSGYAQRMRSRAVPGACARCALAAALLLSGAARADGPDFAAAARDARALLARLVAADTTNPPGNEARAVAIGAEVLRAERMEFKTFEFAPGRENLVARLKGDGSARPVLLLAHVDVVPSRGQAWTTPPHELTEKDGFLYGRGVSDDLSAAAVELETLVLLQRARVPLRRDVIVAWTGDEERGGGGIRWLLEHAPDAIADAEIVLNEGGRVTLGGDGRPRYLALETAEKIYQDFTLRAQGVTGHSSVPVEPNAIARLSRALARIADRPFPERLLPHTREFLRVRAATEPPDVARAIRALVAAKGPLPRDAVATLRKNPVLSALLHTTCVATQLEAGNAPNALPAEARANVNCRIMPDETAEQVLSRLREIVADPGVEIAPVADFGRGGASSMDAPGVDAIRAVMARLHPGVPIVPSMQLGATDSRFLRERGIPSYGIHPVALREEDERRAHGIDERIPADLEPAVRLMYALAVELAARR
jgi:acetylornithine deacetylase/succinyl-diaminopimelate desuccinylase-like protein